MIFTSMAELKLEMALTDAVAASTRGRQQQDFLQKADGAVLRVWDGFAVEWGIL